MIFDINLKNTPHKPIFEIGEVLETQNGEELLIIKYNMSKWNRFKKFLKLPYKVKTYKVKTINE